MGTSSNWVRSAEWTVPIASTEPTEVDCVGGVVTDLQRQQVLTYLSAHAEEETPLQIQ